MQVVPQPQPSEDKTGTHMDGLSTPHPQSQDVGSWSNKRVLQWLLDVDMQQYISVFYEAQVVGQMLLALTPAKVRELKMNIDERHVEALLLLRDSLVGAQTGVAKAQSWTYEVAKDMIRQCMEQETMEYIADTVIQKRSSRVKCVEISVLVCTTLATTLSVSTFGDLGDEAIDWTLQIGFTALTLLATLLSGSLTLLGWREELKNAEELKRVILKINVPLYDAVLMQEKSPEEVRNQIAEFAERFNDLVSKLSAGQWESAVKDKTRLSVDFTDDQINNYGGGLLRRKYPAEWRA